MSLDEPVLRPREAQKANGIQRRAMRTHSSDVWERLKARLTDAVCGGCGRSLYGFQTNALTCGHACRSRAYRSRHGAGTPERKRNQLEGLKEKRLRWSALIVEQIQGMKAKRTWDELAALDSEARARDSIAYGSLVESSKAKAKKWHGMRPDVTDKPPHPDNVAWVAAYRDRTMRAHDPHRKHLAQMTHHPIRGLHDQHAVPDPHDHAASS